GQLPAGAKQVQLSALFEHAPNRLDTGRLRFQVRSNVLLLDQIRLLADARPGIQGTLQLTASGAVDLSPSADGSESFRLVELQADVGAIGLKLTGQPLGDAHLTASSQGSVLRAHLDSSLSNSTVRGDGEWRLDGDYPGSATLTFSRLDLASLKNWV